MSSIVDFCKYMRDYSAKCQIATLITILLFIFFAIGLPLLIKPYAGFDDVTEDCGTSMSMESRRLALYWHNKYRSMVAKGEYTIANKSSKLIVLPQATRMLQLKYNCSLEKSSLKWANQVQCKLIHSGPGENLYGYTAKQSHEDAIVRATYLFAIEISDLGMKDLTDWHGGKGHASQVLWDTTLTVGCGAIFCNNGGTMVVCHYYPAGNYPGVQMYKPGEMLSECGLRGRKEVPHKHSGLCELL